MKKISIIALAGLGLLLASCNKNSTQTPSQEQQVAEKQGDVFAVDTTSSVVNWKAFHKGGFAPRWGTLSLSSGELSLADGQLSAGEFVIDMKSLKVDPASVTEKDKNYAELEGHLKSADFFDVEKNATAEFKVTKVEDLAAATTDAVAGANKTISGNLTLQGKTLNVSFPANVQVADKTVSVKGKLTVNRTDWGIKFGTSEADPAEWMISKDIEIGVDVKATKP
ncbi:YceI family protein [Chryseobacterium caseinilyticum]|uniref:YceI family protein n=1 Tax=Chryseobacterium caseinilyticum TaxID=2771428 RepID=A0ABR8ZC40_9FLAO|nr:YceI family protein [Chryseobacterium caseinilyticum]MBD8082818.1 YceI family protein [Chryseobacterium caseinilyticum]